VCAQAGEVNTGAFDPFDAIADWLAEQGGWLHVDGAFGLWALADPTRAHLVGGLERADSWATDGHKWLNLPFDCGLVFVTDQTAHRASFAQSTSYSVPTGQLRNQKDWNPEWSRRGRGFTAYAAIRALGRSGIAEIVDRCCACADRLVTGIGGLAGAEIVARPIINQGLVRFLARDGNHDRQTDDVIRRIQAKGVAWFGGATWRGMRVMRISVCNWTTTERSVDEAVTTVREAITDTRA
jgi:glutamate/tyrosine decarboxylase-like PLP-dependent enzyme